MVGKVSHHEIIIGKKEIKFQHCEDARAEMY
jgi:hypothetical protein